jgi:thiol-disulfide isomerase/thioredoxin
MGIHHVSYLRCVWFLWVTALFGCTRPVPSSFPQELALWGSDGKAHKLGQELEQSQFSVFIFYSQHCPILRVHENRLKEWVKKYEGRVRFWLVNSEVTADDQQQDFRDRGYPLVLLTDPSAELARFLGAEFATHTIIVDHDGSLRYSGGLDSDASSLHVNARLYLPEALDSLLAHRPVQHPSTEPMGCVLRLH